MATQLVAEIVGDASKFNKATSDAIGHSETLTSKLQNVGKGMVIGAGIASFNLLTTAIQGSIGFVFDSISAASNLNETMSKVGVVFGEASQRVIAWSKDSATAMGISSSQALAAAGTYGNLFVSLGITGDKAADMSTKMVGLAADLASFNNASPEETLAALQSGLVGETEPLRKFGINLNDAALRQEALKLGLTTTTTEVLPASIKAQAAYALILEQSGTAQGDFARTSDGLANQQRIADAKMQDLSATIGQKLLPVVISIETFFVDNLIPAIESIVDAISPLITAIVDGLQPVIVALRPVVEQVFGAIKTVVQSVAPVFKAVFEGIGAAVGFVTGTVFPSLQSAIGVVMGAFGALYGFVQAIWTAIGNAVRGAINGVIGAINGIIGAINGLQVHIHLNLPDPLPDINFDWWGLNLGRLPYLHSGGIVPGPAGSDQLAILQAGERVIPANEAGGGGGSPVIIQLVVDGRELARVVDRNLYYTARSRTKFLPD